MLDKNGVIRLGVGIGNLRSFVASKAYSGLTIACVPRLSGREDFRRVDALTWGGVRRARLLLVQFTLLLLVPLVAPLGFHLSEALKGGVFSPPSFLLLRSPLYVNWRENTSVAILYAGL